ncbi:sarcosine oxidase subunit gamma [Xanthobacter sp. AM11]|uniref:sarcosine oxidase subunit gamma n=1 Tax=Xanthobacter sp. AM11 TaxID=3380643 RepID=UPI0039BF8BEF
MADLIAHLAPTRLLPEGHYGADGAAGVSARLVEGLAAATLVARRGAAGRLAAACAAAGLPLADAPRLYAGAGLEAVGTGPGRWLVFAPETGGAALRSRLAALAADLAAVTDQSDANLVFDISGAKARDALAKCVAVDLHPSAFRAGDAATTLAAHAGVTFWLADAAPVFRFAVPRSFAPAVLRALCAAAAEYGFALAGTGRG